MEGTLVSEKVNPYRVRFIIVAVVVCIAATFVSNFFGSLASMMYAYSRPPLNEGRYDTDANRELIRFVKGIGIQVATVGGLLAGILWCRRMSRRLRNGETNRLARNGAWAGVKVGVLATLLLHIALMLASRRVALIEPAIGLVCGIIAGMILGAVFGAICQAMVQPAAGGQPIVEHNGESPA